jgi:uncharacterized repeat protein (TIGR01451 family)
MAVSRLLINVVKVMLMSLMVCLLAFLTLAWMVEPAPVCAGVPPDVPSPVISGPVVYQAHAGDNFTLSRNGPHIQLWDGSQTLRRQSDYRLTSRFVLTGADGVDDRLMADFSGGNPIPSGGLSFEGGAGGFDTLVLSGGQVDTVMHRALSASSGLIDIDGYAINYTGLEPIADSLVAGTRIFTFSVLADDIILGDDANPSDGFSRIESVSSSETYIFANPAAGLIIYALYDSDLINVTGLDDQWNAGVPVTVDGGLPSSAPGDTLNYALGPGPATDYPTGTGEGYIIQAGAPTLYYRNIETVIGATSAPTFSITSSQPVAHAINVPLTSTIAATFSANVDGSTVNTGTFTAFGDQSGLLTGTYALAGDMVAFDPFFDFTAGEGVNVIATVRVRSSDGAVLKPHQWGFTAGVTRSRCFSRFVDIGAGPEDVWNGGVDWGDYDNDGDLDILLSGFPSAGPRVSQVWRNNGDDTFTDINAGLVGFQQGDAAWGDYDNDGDLDILLTGWAGADTVTQVWRNNGDDTFTNINAGLPGGGDGSVAWGDYDNDGDLDILLTGYDSAIFNAVSQVWRNNGDDTFSDINAGLPGLNSGAAAWGDYDDDGDLDILLAGDNAAIFSSVSEIWRNNGDGTFGYVDAGLTGISSGSVAWGDYDNDGDLDIVLTGQSGTDTRVSQVWRNNEDDTFTDINAGLTALQSGSVAWGDYDNDGDLDILLTGWTGTDDNYASQVWRNNGDATFTDIDAGLPGVGVGPSVWGDYDGDGDLDILLTGYDGVSPLSQVWRNEDCASLVITKTVELANPAAPSPGDPITYTIVVANSGGDAENVTVKDSLPVGVDGNSLDWTGTVSAGGTLTFTISASIAPNAGHGMTITNTASFSHTTNSGSDTAAFTVVDTTPPDISALTLITPTGGITLTDAQPTFDWSDAMDSQSGVVSYTLLVTCSNDSVSVTTTDSSFTPTADMATGVYTWTVRAHDAAGNASAYVSPAETFVIDAESSCIKVYLPIVLKDG